MSGEMERLLNLLFLEGDSGKKNTYSCSNF